MEEQLLIETSRFYQELENPEIKELVRVAWASKQQAADILKSDLQVQLDNCNEVCSVTEQLLIKRKAISPGVRAGFVDVMMTAGLLHNIIYEPGNWVTLFSARKELDSVGLSIGMPRPHLDALWQTIEGQLGEDTPVPNVKPAVNTPTEMFATAIWIVYELQMSGKNMPTWN